MSVGEAVPSRSVNPAVHHTASAAVTPPFTRQRGGNLRPLLEHHVVEHQQVDCVPRKHRTASAEYSQSARP